MSILRQKKIILTAVIPLFLIIALSVQSYAATTVNTNTSFVGLAGMTYTVEATGFTADNPAYMVTLTNVTSLATAWTNASTITTVLTAGNWQFQVLVKADSGLAADAYVATIQVNQGAGYNYTASIPFNLAADTTDSTQSMTFVFDMGSATVQDASAIVLTIDKA